MSHRAEIAEEMAATAEAQGKRLAPLTDELVLIDSGLDSLGFAILVSRLEDRLGFDPFTESETAYFPVSFGDFVRFYDQSRG